MLKEQNIEEIKELKLNIPDVGSVVSFYQSSNKDLTDTGRVVSIIKNDTDGTNPILEIKPNTMHYKIIWRTVKELIKH